LFWLKLKEILKPDLYLDTEVMSIEISQKTGIDLKIIEQVLDAETDYMIRVGIAKEL